MAYKSASGNVAEMYLAAQSYLNSKIKFLKLSLLEKTSLAGTFFLSSLILVLIVSVSILFLSFAFAYWYGQRTGNTANGILIVAGFYILVALVFIIGRKYFVTRPITRNVTSIIFMNDDEENETE